MATQNIPTTNSPKIGSTDSNGFYLRLVWSGTYDDVTGAATVNFSTRLYSTNNNFSQWTINSSISVNGSSIDSSSVQRTLAKNSYISLDSGTFTVGGWNGWLLATNGNRYLNVTAAADGVGTASYIPNNTSVGTVISVTPVSAPVSYTVSYSNPYGSAGNSSESVLSGNSGTFPNPGSRTNYTFNGWENNSSYYPGASTPQITGPTTYTATSASWTYVPPSGGTNYNYSYQSNGGSNTPGSSSVASGTSITLGTPGTKSGYTFSGWYIDSGLSTSAGSGGNNDIGDPHTITADTIFYAKWTSTTSTLPAWPSPAPALAQFIAGQPYTDSVTASNMSGGTYSISVGSLPGGISINSSTGALTGTVTTGTDYSFTVLATNSNGAASQAYSGTITGILRVRQGEGWVKTVAKKREGEIWKPGTVRIWSNNTWLYGS